MGWLKVIHQFLRLGPLGLAAIAVAVLGVGYVLQVKSNATIAQNAVALAAGPPVVVDIETTPDTDAEVVVRAQLLWSQTYDLWYERDLGTDYVVMFPLVAANSANMDNVIGVAMFEADDDRFEMLTPELAKEWFVDDGKFGPVMDLNGELDGLGQWQGLVEESFWDEGLVMPENPVVIWPYVKGRDVALAPPAPGSMTIFGLLSKIAGAIGLLALGKLVFGTKSEDEVADGHEPDAMTDPSLAVATAPAQSSAVPLWKQRSGLVDDSAAANPEPTEQVQFDNTFVKPQPAEGATVAPKRSGLGVRKILIGLVGGLFVLGLVSTVYDLVAKSSSTETVAVTSSDDLAAATIADIIVPDADPNRHWTDIDVTPVVEWFVAKGMLAATGDTDAMFLLGGMIGGLFAALLALRWFFLIRRTLRPQTTTRFGDMGIN